MSTRTLASIAVAVCVAAGSAGASSIGVFFDAAGTDCDLEVVENFPFTIYVIATLGGDAAAGGITGAEYRLVGTDPGWVTTVTPDPTANLVLGSPIDGQGVALAWPTCQTPTTGMLLLHTIDVFPLGTPVPRTLAIEPVPCIHLCLCLRAPRVALCDPDFTYHCVAGGQAFLNRTTPCTVAVGRTTWTRVKGLYRD